MREEELWFCVPVDLSLLPSSSSHSPSPSLPPLSFLSMLSRVGSLNIDVSIFGRERGSTSSVLGARPHHSSAPHIADQVCEVALQGSSVYSLLPFHVLCLSLTQPNLQTQFEAETTVEVHNQ